MVTFVRRVDKLWNVSLYSTKPEIDCGEIAKSFGGGGHKGAAGFQGKELPFKI
jgi:nanoRNase/pAp phosphatase (c-di-AMP/oligoRNAs hydrolase)